jgi:hypothetical protein
MKLTDFLYRLFFTRDDDLDLLQIFFLVLVCFFVVSFTLAGLGIFEVTTAAWATFGSVFGILAIAGTPTWIARLIAKSKMPGELAKGIASSGNPESSTDLEEIITQDAPDPPG